MDVTLAKTFLAVVETGSFVEAANRVFVTQSTVSARIKSLEDQLGKVLFERSKAGASPTPAGVQFQKHAQAMVRVWEHARLEISLPEGYEASLTVGGQYSLWEGYLLEWLTVMRHNSPQVAIRAQVGFSDTLMQDLIDGTLDLGVMYTPQGRPGFEVQMLFEDELILVTGDAASDQMPVTNYVFIDWGPEFRADHALNFPEISVPGTYLELGSLSMQYLVQSKSAGYVPRRIAAQHLKAGTLKQVRKAPEFSYPAYAVYPSDADADLLQVMLDELMTTAERIDAETQ
ncbi:MAG: LysR family transcriptional regulator [Rhizobiales bacterium]|nr:LysR family transcriptional regulator [Hyphomicrobiales bacterium]